MTSILAVSKLWAWCLGLVLLWSFPAVAQRITSPSVSGNLSREMVLTRLAQSQVIYLGETHDRPQDHATQLEILQSLHRQHPKIAVALEMFQRPYQKVLERFLAGEITEAQLRSQSQYDQHWGFPWEYYAPVLRYARQNQLPLIALNTPTEVTRKVAQQGLESLTPVEQKWIPPLTEIQTDNPAYRQRLLEIYQQSHQHAGAADNFERFFQAQVVWDETMAAAIAEFLNQNPDYQVVVLAGQGHVIYGDGIPSRVTRRLDQRSELIQQSILLLNPEQLDPDASRPAADYVWETIPHPQQQ